MERVSLTEQNILWLGFRKGFHKSMIYQLVLRATITALQINTFSFLLQKGSYLAGADFDWWFQCGQTDIQRWRERKAPASIIV